MVRIFAVLNDIGSEYEAVAPIKISLKPFKKNCYYMDLEDGKQYKTVYEEDDTKNHNWKPWSGVFKEYSWYDPVTKRFGDEDSEYFLDEDGYSIDGILEGDKCQKYEKGVPVGEPYFEQCK